MKSPILLVVCFALALAGLALFTDYHRGETLTRVAGLPVISFGANDGAWLAFGGLGVLVIGVGLGVVSLSIYGAGILFATGQLAVGLTALGQLGLGFFLFLGQVGAGLHVGAQGGLGFRRWTQGNNRDESYFRSLWGEVGELLTPWRRPDTTPSGPSREARR